MNSQNLRDAFKYLYPNELPALKRLVASLPPDPVVINIGAGAGTSGLAIVETRADVTLYTIDVQDESSPFGCLEAERQVFERAGYSRLSNTRWFQIKGDSVQVGRGWPFGPVDMVFVDGDHSYEGCRGDIEAWLPHIKPGGLLAIHDYNKQMLPADPQGPHPKPWPGVNQAVNELMAEGQHRLHELTDSLISFVVAPQQGQGPHPG